MKDHPLNSMQLSGQLVDASDRTIVEIPGGQRTDFPDGSHLIEGPEGDKYLVSETGDISATIPEIQCVKIDDLSLVLQHQIAHVHETTSHTLRFVGGGIFSYLHHRDGRGTSIEANRVLFRTLPGGVIVVCGTAPSHTTNSSV
ncbi:hypothetical protein [Burkholderia stagnalis]|uniref:hypothetical protein n=1 Tax=Burkholderia stagnalis TaxID=1503054 RepID=UPI001F49A232|nr:hypothetical protein [Burkholderia stagnalis]